MAYEVIVNKPGLYRILLEEYPEGVYIYIFESPNGPGPEKDYLEHDLESAKRICKMEYGIEEHEWREVPNENMHGRH